MLRMIGVVAAVLAALSVGACQERRVTKAEYDDAIAYLKKHPKEVEGIVNRCALDDNGKQGALHRKMMAISVGTKPGASSKDVCSNTWKAIVDGRVSYEEFYEYLVPGR